MSSQPVPVRTPLQVVGVCGQTVELIVNGVNVSFTCLPPSERGQPGPPEPPPPSPHGTETPPSTVFVPGEPRPPHIATIDVGQLSPELFAEPETMTRSDPLVVKLERGGEFAGSDFAPLLESAREQQRSIRFEIE